MYHFPMSTITREAADRSATRSGRRFRCDNCPRYYTARREDQRFCSSNCRKEFHKYGGAYAKLHGLIEPLVLKEVNRVLGEMIDARLREVQLDSRLDVVHHRIEELRRDLERARFRNASADKTPPGSPQTPDVVSTRTPDTSRH